MLEAIRNFGCSLRKRAVLRHGHHGEAHRPDQLHLDGDVRLLEERVQCAWHKNEHYQPVGRDHQQSIEESVRLGSFLGYWPQAYGPQEVTTYAHRLI